MVHYFGQPQDIIRFKNFSKENCLWLIEDNAHGHGGTFNGELLGTFGDFGISSPRKILGSLRSGGLLFWNRPDVPISKIPRMPEFPVSKSRRTLSRFLRKIPKLAIARNFLGKTMKSRPCYENPNAFRELMIDDYAMDPFSLDQFNTANWSTIRKLRQKAYRYWAVFTHRRGLEPVFKVLHPEANPWCCPVYVKNQREAIYWFNWGWQNNYQVFSWPNLPEETIDQNGVALRRWKKLVCFSTDSFPNI